MIHKIGWILLLGIALTVGILKLFGWAYDPVKFYNKSGQIFKDPKIWTDTVNISSASQTVDISSAGFVAINSVEVMSEFNSSTSTVLPIAEIKSYSNTQVVINLVQSKTTTVGVLGASVDGLQALQAFTSTRVHLIVNGY